LGEPALELEPEFEPQPASTTPPPNAAALSRNFRRSMRSINATS
jgi:hypothetical protein